MDFINMFIDSMPCSIDLSYMERVVILLCVGLCTFKITSLLIKRSNLVRHLKAFPGPPAHWFFGHTLEVMKRDGTAFDKSVAWGVRFPFAFPIWFGPFLSILNLHHPDYVKTLLSSTEPKDDIAYRFIKPWIGDGLLVSSGQKWFNHRRLLTPGFHYKILKPYVKTMADCSRLMLDKWEGYSQTNEFFEVFGPVSLMSLDNIMRCAFSNNSNCQNEGETNTYIKAVYELSDLVSMRIRVFPYHSDLIFYLSPHGFRFRRACRVTHRHTEEVIRKRKEALMEEAKPEQTQAKRNLDFLDILLCARDEDDNALSDEVIRAEVDTFMFEGHDTTASSISFLMYSLASHPQHQEICRDEILQVLGDKETLDWDDLSKIPYTTMCIKESLRLYPAVPGISRKLTKTMTFIDGRSMPEGSYIGAGLYSHHRNSTIWENPKVFDPLRFLPENVSKRHPHAFLPFSAGPRNCIGQNFAMNEMKVVIAQTLRRYQLMADPARPPKVAARLVLCSLNGIYIKIKPLQPGATTSLSMKMP
ncbi:cytochrome P450 4B1 isoform X1 [Gadus morhua]|uniref:cytochrome P450 4B1 isoform X1 n=1 Tax=Gadus morhua TaxID=8049 RepID=UPI0011B50C5A|nr:cytochrome P450 4B1-like isoform X1 [Gadus morhua]